MLMRHAETKEKQICYRTDKLEARCEHTHVFTYLVMVGDSRRQVVKNERQLDKLATSEIRNSCTRFGQTGGREIKQFNILRCSFNDK